MTPIDFNAIIGGVSDVGLSLGVFESVNRFEPTNSPDTGLTCAVWAVSLKPDQRSSGLAVTSAILLLNAMIMSPDPYKPKDGEDPRILDAASRYMAALSADFDISTPSGTAVVDNVDLHGAGGNGQLDLDMGYVRMAGEAGELYRMANIAIPLALRDVWAQER